MQGIALYYQALNLYADLRINRCCNPLVRNGIKLNVTHYFLGRPNLQKVPETLLPGARLRAFSKLFLDLASFFQSEVV